MKKLKSIIAVLILMCITAAGYAQKTIPPAPITGWSGSLYPEYDTLATVGLLAKNFVISGKMSMVAVQINVAKYSGTLAVWVTLSCSIDTGATYFPYAVLPLKDTTAGVYRSYYFNNNSNPGYYWQWSVNTTGTCAASITTWKLPRKSATQ